MKSRRKTHIPPPTGQAGAQASAPSLLQRALLHHAQGDLVQAEQCYRQLLERDPSNGEAHCNLGVLLGESGRIAEAEQALRAAVSESPENVDAQANLGVILRRRGKLPEALKQLREALSRGPAHENANYNLGVTLIDMGREQEAIAPLERAVATNPDNVLARANLARVLHHAGRDEEALQHGLQALRLKDGHSCAAFRRHPGAGLQKDPTDGSFLLPPFKPDQPERNIIAFSLWGSDQQYTQGAAINARIAPYLYPEWTCRFYCDRSVPQGVIHELERSGAQVVLCESRGPGHGLFWRFYAANDPTIDRFICRDCDSRLNMQERVAVDEWLASDQPFHIMRDAVFHTELILAGMWGGVSGLLPDMKHLTDDFFRAGRHRWMDQDFLRAVVWPLIKDHALCHDSYYEFHGARQFPSFGRRPPRLHVGAVEKVTLREIAMVAAGTEGSQSDAIVSLLSETDHIRARRCRHGVMIYNDHDTFIGKSLRTYGEWCESELELLGQLLRPGDVVCDIGANIGTHTIFFAKRVGEAGRVLALEPQRQAFQLLCANVGLNQLQNVSCLQQGVGDAECETWIPLLNPASPQNMGALRIDQQDEEGGELIRVTTLDRLAATQRIRTCRLVKIDVEGMEGRVLDGAVAFLEACKPVIFIENNEEEHSREIIARLLSLGYRSWWHIAPYFNRRNYFNCQDNVFEGRCEANMLSIHSSIPANIDLPPVTGPDDHWKAAIARMREGRPPS